MLTSLLDIYGLNQRSFVSVHMTTTYSTATEEELMDIAEHRFARSYLARPFPLSAALIITVLTCIHILVLTLVHNVQTFILNFQYLAQTL